MTQHEIQTDLQLHNEIQKIYVWAIQDPSPQRTQAL